MGEIIQFPKGKPVKGRTNQSASFKYDSAYKKYDNTLISLDGFTTTTFGSPYKFYFDKVEQTQDGDENE